MKIDQNQTLVDFNLRLSSLPVCAKALITALLAVMTLAMAGAAAQVWVHDIIPTFYDTAFDTAFDTAPDTASDTAPDTAKDSAAHGQTADTEPTVETGAARGDLFADMVPAEPQEVPQPAFHRSEQFVWLLKWSHIHLFGMNMIFILLGIVTILLDLSDRQRTWLAVLPFVGVVVDIAAMWLKTFVHPVFFWMHIPGGGLFGLVFGIVTLRAIYEMWLRGALPKSINTDGKL